jgi:uncharacterized delta-60 repeat protein
MSLYVQHRKNNRPLSKPFGTRALAWASAAFLAGGVFQDALRADAGDLDSKFGTDGKVITDFGGEEAASALAIGTRGIIVVAGRTGPSFSEDILLVRYGANGGLDTSFGDGGKVITDLGVDETPSDIGLQGDGKILVLAEANVFSEENDFLSRDVLLLRYDSDGTLDEGFGEGGVVTVADFDSAASVAVARNGKIIVGGSARIDEQSDFAVRRYETDGSVDESFGEEGLAILDLGPGDQLVSLALQRNGKIVIAGDFEVEDEGSDFVVARFNGDGILDESFGDQGMVTTGFNEFDDTAAVAIARNGKIIVAGTSAEFDGPDQAVFFRYNRDGSRDGSFGTGGVAGGFLGGDVGQRESVFDMALQKDGKIVVTGRILRDEEEGEFEPLVARLGRSGGLDPRFGEGGLAITDFNPVAVAIQGNGRIIAAGRIGDDIVLAGYRAR